MTLISKRKTIIRGETSVYSHRLRPFVVTLGPYSFEIREKGCRKGFVLDWESAFSLAVKKAVAAERAERKARKRGKR